jgi:hypothetical protein
MPRYLRQFLLGCIGLTFAYLLIHSREPLRLSIGDPWSDANVLSSIKYVKQYGFLETSFTDILDIGPLTADSYRYIHYPPLAEIFYGVIGKLGASDIATFRLFGIGFSALAMWLLFSYARRMYDDTVALIATTLFTTSLFWMTYADSMHQAPIMQATGWLALWGLVRAIETRQRRHYAAAALGSFACFFTSYDYWLFLPAAVLFTVWVKAGNPFRRGNFHFVLLCAAGCLIGIAAKCACVIGAVGWNEFIADIRLQFFERATSTHDRKFDGPVPTLVRRITLVFTPLAWLTFAYHGWKTLRAPSVIAALRDTAIWMLIVALMFFYVFAQLAGSQVLASQVLLPFYAIGSALLIAKLLDTRRWIAIGWLVAAPLWGFYFMMTTPRSVMDRDDVAKVNAYMDAHDHNDFMFSNVLSDGHIQASFERHYQSALDGHNPLDANLQALSMFELMGADHVHAAIFTTPESRFIDKSLWPLAMPRRMWSVTGWPQLYREKAYGLIREYDHLVMKSLDWVGADKIMELDNFNLYRIDRDTVMKFLAQRVPLVSRIDFGSADVHKHMLIGWGGPMLYPDERDNIPRVGVSTILGYSRCVNPDYDGPDREHNRCKTVLTKVGVVVHGAPFVAQAQLMVRVERACDLKLTMSFAKPAFIKLWMNDFEARPAPGTEITVVVPQRSVKAGVDVITFEDVLGLTKYPSVEITTLAIEPQCQ